jgi:hypothetical protein
MLMEDELQYTTQLAVFPEFGRRKTGLIGCLFDKW